MPNGAAGDGSAGGPQPALPIGVQQQAVSRPRLYSSHGLRLEGHLGAQILFAAPERECS